MILKKHIPNSFIHYAEIGNDADKRNYMVSYDKIHALGYETTISLEEGVLEILKTLPALSIVSNYHNVYNKVQNT